MKRKKKNIIKRKDKTTEQLRLWDELQDIGVNQYLELVAIIELVVDNKKEMFNALHKQISTDVFEQAVTLAGCMRSELAQSVKVSVESKKKFRTILAKLIAQNIKG